MNATTTKKNILILGIIAIAVIWLPMLIFKIPYNQPDDCMMNYIANGSYIGDRSNLIYPGLLYGMLLSVMYRIIPAINWFCVTYLLLLCADVFIFLYVVGKLENRIAFICTVFIGALLPLFVTFTVVAYVSIGAGFCLAMYLSQTGEKRWGKYIAAALPIIFGYAIRGNALLSAGALLLPMAVMLLIEVKASKKEWITALAGMALLMAVLLVCASGLHKYRQPFVWVILIVCTAAGYIIGTRSNIYKGLFLTIALVCVGMIALGFSESILLTGDWREFRQYTAARAAVLDSPRTKYANVSDRLTQLGITESGNSLLFRWIFADKQVFSADALRSISEVYKAKHSGIPIKSLVTDHKTLTCIFLPIAAAVISGAAADRKRRLLITLTMIMTELLFGALVLRQRFVYRVAVPLCVISVIEMFIVAGGEAWKKKNHFNIAISFAVSICVAVVGMSYVYLLTEKEKSDPIYEEAVQYVRNHPENNYVVQSYAYNKMYYKKPALEVKYDSMLVNSIKSGSGDSFSPRFYDTMNAWGVSDSDRLLMELTTNESLRYIDAEADDLRTYLEEQTGSQVNMEIEQSFDDKLFVYRFSE